MTTFNQWIEGKKKDDDSKPGELYKHGENTGYIQAIDNLQASLPTLLSTMEAEILEKIGEKSHVLSTNDVGYGVGINTERSRIHKIIHEYFKTQI